MNKGYTIRAIPAGGAGVPAALALVRRVFMEFEAPDYTEEGVREFMDFIAPEAVAQKMTGGQLLLWGCFEGEKIIGIIATRAPGHIALLFVDKEYHRRGIAKALCNTAAAFGRQQNACDKITVNSSPYAVPAYRGMGFTETAEELTVNGLRFTPMEKPLV